MVRTEVDFLNSKPLIRSAKKATVTCPQNLRTLQDTCIPRLPEVFCKQTQGCAATKLDKLQKPSRIPALDQFKKSSNNSSYIPPRFLSSEPARIYSKNVQSKIPVAKKPVRLLPTCCSRKEQESSLTAADRRQKFHQSRHPVITASECNKKAVQIFSLYSGNKCATVQGSHIKLQALIPGNNTDRIKTNQQKPVYFPGDKKKLLNRQHNGQNQIPVTNIEKDCLPPILPSKGTSCISTFMPADNQQGKKKKGLLGEFTHFPAVCNVLPFKSAKHLTLSSIPSLPPIMPYPPAPPPSISASLEKEISSKDIFCEARMENINNTQNVSTKIITPCHFPTLIQPNITSVEAPEHWPTHFVHTVSIIVELVDMEIGGSKSDCNTSDNNSGVNPSLTDNKVKTIMDAAQLRKEAFARLLEEHAQIVQEIKKVQTGQI